MDNLREVVERMAQEVIAKEHLDIGYKVKEEPVEVKDRVEVVLSKEGIDKDFVIDESELKSRGEEAIGSKIKLLNRWIERQKDLTRDKFGVK